MTTERARSVAHLAPRANIIDLNALRVRYFGNDDLGGDDPVIIEVGLGGLQRISELSGTAGRALA